jgi:hypothetical protein
MTTLGSVADALWVPIARNCFFNQISEPLVGKRLAHFRFRIKQERIPDLHWSINGNLEKAFRHNEGAGMNTPVIVYAKLCFV